MGKEGDVLGGDAGGLTSYRSREHSSEQETRLAIADWMVREGIDSQPFFEDPVDRKHIDGRP